MSLVDDIGPDDGGDDMLAAEYVLGVQTIEERRLVAARIDAEQAFARLVDGWQAHFAPLAAAFAAVEVPASVKAAIDRRLFSGATASARQPARPGMFSSLAFWRALSVAALAALALYIALPLLRPPPADVAREQLVASLAADGSAVRYLAVYDEAANEIGLSRVAGEPASGRDFELWVIEGQQAPVSLGVIPDGGSARLPVSEALRQKMISGAVVAISDEPDGGSPTGQPTGAVVAAGDLRAI
jgi:anti-sigma-K factor RskA